VNIAEFAIQKKIVTLVLCLVIIGTGIVSYENLGRLEDPEFTIKQAIVTTVYPGATPLEVAEEVTDEIETAIQQLPQLKRVVSVSKAGLSIVTAEIEDKYDKRTLPQVWDELRRKVRGVESRLPPGALTPMVNDDFGDVYGILLAATGDGYSYEELEKYVKFLRRELLLIEDVSKVELWGLREEAVFVEISRSRIVRLGIGLDVIYSVLQEQNVVASAGSVKVGSEYIRIHPTGEFRSVQDIAALQIRDPSSDRMIYLKDVATITRGYMTPPYRILRYNGRPALSIGISIVPGGNVVKLGEAVKRRLAELEARTPVGIELGVINFQAENVSKAVKGFMVNLLEATSIVVAVLLIFMGMRSGFLIGAILVLTVLGTMVFMNIFGINLQRVSLGALIIALGMLVDNAIVVTEGILIRVKAGMDRIGAAREVVGQTMIPLLGATAVAVLAFAAIGVSEDATGEYLGSLFQVMLISLMISWGLAITVTPLFCTLFIKGRNADSRVTGRDPYQGVIFITYQKFMRQCLSMRWVTMIVMAGFLGTAIYGFGLSKNSFFPESTRHQFQLHYWLPAGTDIRRTSQDLGKIERHLLADERVVSTASYIGAGATRFMLAFSPETSMDKGYGLVLVSVRDYRDIDPIIPELMGYVTENFPDAQPIFEKFKSIPGASVQVRFNGSDPAALRQLSNKAKTIMKADPNSYAVRDDWRQKVKVIRPQFSETQARLAGISRPVLSRALEMAFTGISVGVYREGDKLLPIIVRQPEEERVNVDNITDLQVWSSVTRKAVPVGQIVSGFATGWEDPLVRRRNRKLTITTSCDPLLGVLARTVFERVRPKIEAIELLPGYEMEWGGEYENSTMAQEKLFRSIPVAFLVMVFITIMLFNNLRQPLIIWLTVPLAIIGVAVGLLGLDLPFDFMALLGFISLVGMLVKNAVVLMDQINIELRQGKAPLCAVIDAAVSRLRPVTMTAVTTMLGMAPLLQDIFFRSMAVTIISGLGFATVLTLIVVPVLYAIFFRVPYEGQGKLVSTNRS